MFFKQIYLGCLAQASYLIGSKGEAAVVDPRRDVDVYLQEAEAQGLTIRHVFETHLHADFVSGHRELAKRTGATIYFGYRANAAFPHIPLRDGDEIPVGDVLVRVLETPGHTIEGVSLVLIDTAQSNRPQAVLTGDTLFIGDVGRPDLVGETRSAEEMAGLLYDSLHQKLLALPDDVQVWPAHGAGSLCGRNISKETSSTIGLQRLSNWALRPMSKEEFVRLMTADLPEAPAYFARDAKANRAGETLLDDLPPPPALPPAEVARRQADGAIVLDTRPSALFGTAHVPGSIHIGLSGEFASWAGSLVDPSAPLLIVAEEPERVEEARMRLARVGIENVAGYLEGGIEAWEAAGLPLASTEQITVDELALRLSAASPPALLDVRRPGEWQAGRIASAVHAPLHRLPAEPLPVQPEDPVAAICAGGFRSSIATSLLERRGYRRVSNVVGGMAAWTREGRETVTAAPRPE
jgi:glyoxylase-like metal-dependent hydrolase (beta-lactamase superfamily II)/rhodanese-related sulfurtransferase